MKTTVLTVAYNDRGLIDYMIKSVTKHTPSLNKIIICNNGDMYKTLDKHRGNPKIDIIERKIKHSSNSSVDHGNGLNTILPLVETEITAIVESDCVVLCDGWDEIPSGCDMIACKKKEDNAGLWYYHPCLLVVKTDIIKNVNFLPKPRSEKGEESRKCADVGWDISTYIPNSKVKLLDARHPKNKNTIKLPDIFQYRINEFVLDDKLYGIHYWRGSGIDRKGDGWKTEYGNYKKFLKSILGEPNDNVY